MIELSRAMYSDSAHMAELEVQRINCHHNFTQMEEHFGRRVWVTRKGAIEARRGMWAIAVNRALPGVRAVTFFAAGVARLPLGKTMAFGLISNIGWTLAILALGTAVGESAEKIESVFAVYKTVLYSLGGAAVVALLVVWWWRKRRAP